MMPSPALRLPTPRAAAKNNVDAPAS
jgi:hypothetical protein